MADPDKILTPFDLVGGEVKRKLGPVPVLVVGTGGPLPRTGNSVIALSHSEHRCSAVRSRCRG